MWPELVLVMMMSHQSLETLWPSYHDIIRTTREAKGDIMLAPDKEMSSESSMETPVTLLPGEAVLRTI